MRSPRARFVRSRPVREERVDDVLFIIDQQGKAIHALTPLSAGIWLLLGEPVSITETKHIVKQAFPTVPHRKVARDVEEIFVEFEKHGLIRPVL
jgi:hypothetical protein